MTKLLAAALFLCVATFASAQAPATTPSSTTTTTTTTAPAPKMEKKHRMSHKMATTTTATGASGTTTTTTTGTTPATTGTTTATMPASTHAMKHATGQHHAKRTLAEEQASAAKSAARDKVISKDAAGHDIHLGPNGGEYYINKEGTKTYLKAGAKVKAN